MKAAEMRLPSFALHWARELGEDPNSLKRLRGGINNRVFLCGKGAQKWVIKGYEAAHPGQRDRMQAEQQFLQFASQVAPGFTPALIHTDQDRRCVVLENLDGKLFCEGVPPPGEAVTAAVQFIHLLNRESRLARESITTDAAEGFLSLRKHLANVQERLEAMNCDHVKTSDKPIAESLLRKIGSDLGQVEERTHNLIAQGIATDAIRPDQRCISPSDFGFHNAISTKTGVMFIDFEYAGWDDPAKATIDFILQPRVPVVGYGSPLLAAWDPEYRHFVNARCRHLEPILRLKWLCIMLAVLNPARLKHMVDITSANDTNRFISERIERAKSYLRTASN